MKVLSILILKSIRFFIAMVIVAGGQAAIADNIIYEGVSVPGGFYIGMSRDEVNKIGGHYLVYGDADSRDCRIGNKCTLLTKNSNIVDFIFEREHVTQLEIKDTTFGRADKRQLETPVGAAQRMSPEEVAALYQGAVINNIGSRKKEVVVAHRGYTFKSRLQCPYNNPKGVCIRWASHKIYKPTSFVNAVELLYSFLSLERGEI